MTPNKQPSDGQQHTSEVNSSGPLAERKAVQRLSQEQATFEQKKLQDARWFILRMAMGILAMLIIPTMIVLCVLIISDPHQDMIVKRLAASALLVDILGLMCAVWRVILNPASVSQLAPITAVDEKLSTIAAKNSANQAVPRSSNPHKPTRSTDPVEPQE
jgi:hypothetical protein